MHVENQVQSWVPGTSPRVFRRATRNVSAAGLKTTSGDEHVPSPQSESHLESRPPPMWSRLLMRSSRQGPGLHPTDFRHLHQQLCPECSLVRGGSVLSACSPRCHSNASATAPFSWMSASTSRGSSLRPLCSTRWTPVTHDHTRHRGDARKWVPASLGEEEPRRWGLNCGLSSWKLET